MATMLRGFRPSNPRCASSLSCRKGALYSRRLTVEENLAIGAYNRRDRGYVMESGSVLSDTTERLLTDPAVRQACLGE